MHDFHLSKMDVHYKTDQEALQITVLSFIDDLEEALNKENPLDYKLLQEAEHPNADSLLAIYLAKHLELKVDGKGTTFNYIGKEESENIISVYSYLEITNIKNPSLLEIDNSILMETFDDQKNIISFKIDNKPKGTHILTKRNHSQSISF